MISTKGRYALRVMIDIAQNSHGNFVRLDEIAARQNISEKYLEGILASLTKAGLLLGLRGKGGGYKLTQPPQAYTTEQILSATERTLFPVACLEEGADCANRQACPTRKFWEGLNDALLQYLQGVTLADLLSASPPVSDFIRKTEATPDL